MSSSTLIPNQNDSLTGPCCQNCGSAQPAGEPVCRRCGYYAVLGKVIELEEYDQEGQPAQQKQPQSAWEIWSSLIPVWGWGLMLCVGAVIAANVAGSLLLEVGSPARTLWSLSQLGICALAMILVHIFAYVTHMMMDASASMLDFILRPLVCWKPVMSKLPRTFWRVAILVSAVTGILMSLIVLRSLNYEALLDWGIKPAPKSNLLGAVIDQAKKIKAKDQNLEEALNSLDDPTKDLEEKPKVIPKIHVDCVIVGYTTTKEDPTHLSGLVMAGDVKGKLKIIGIVSHNIPEDVRELLNQRLPTIVRATPFVDSAIRAIWVEPQLVCRVKCIKQNQNGQLEEPDFDQLLTEISLEK